MFGFGPFFPVDDFLAGRTSPVFLALGLLHLFPVLGCRGRHVPLETGQGATDHVAFAARHRGIGFWAVGGFTGEARRGAAVFGIVVVLFETPLAKVVGAEEASDTDDGVEVTDPFGVDQVQVDQGPVLVLVVRDSHELIAQGGRYHRDPDPEGFLELGQVVERSRLVVGDAGGSAEEEGQVFLLWAAFGSQIFVGGHIGLAMFQ